MGTEHFACVLTGVTKVQITGPPLLVNRNEPFTTGTSKQAYGRRSLNRDPFRVGRGDKWCQFLFTLNDLITKIKADVNLTPARLTRLTIL